MTITYADGVSIAKIVVYVPALAIATLLVFRHGFGRSSGWYFLVIFCLARIVGPCMELATISHPNSIGLYTGYTILQSIGISPLELATLGLLTRVLDSIHKSHDTLVHKRVIRLVQLIITVGLILGIIGGIDASNNLQKTGHYHAASKSKIGVGLLIAAFVCIVVITFLTSFSVSHAEPGEKRILAAVAISLPFLLVRIVYSALSTYTTFNIFNQISGSVTVLLCLAVIEEFIVVFVYEAVGITLRKIPKSQNLEGGQQIRDSADGTYVATGPSQGSAAGSKVKRIAQRTIIGRIVTSVMSSRDRKNNEVDLQQYH